MYIENKSWNVIILVFVVFFIRLFFFFYFSHNSLINPDTIALMWWANASVCLTECFADSIAELIRF